jgi:hypothetical protein
MTFSSPLFIFLEDALIENESCRAFKDWDLCRLSRKRGREDALVTKSLLRQAVVDLTAAEDNPQLMSDPEIFRGLCLAVIKNCFIRPSESVNTREWEVAWLAKLKSLVPSLDEDTTADSVDMFVDNDLEDGDLIKPDVTAGTVCRYCGFDQYTLASQFVWGQTWGEWELEGDSAAVVVTDKRRKLLDEGGKNKIWIPTSPYDADVERAECSKCSIRFPRKGSLVVHECCAESMSIARQVALGRVERAEEQRIVDILVGVGRAKTTPVGCDANGHLYWVFSGCSSLFVCMQPSAADAGSRPSSDGLSQEFQFVGDCGIDTLATEGFKAGAARYINASSTRALETNRISDLPLGSSLDNGSFWLEYKELKDIGRVIQWLRNNEPDERLLKRMLLLLFPTALQFVSNGHSSGSSFVDSQSASSIVTKKRPASSLTFDSEDDDDLSVASKGNVREVLKRKLVVDLGKPVSLTVGQRILAEAPVSGIVFSGRILEIKEVCNKWIDWDRCYVGHYDSTTKKENANRVFKIRFDNWGYRYDAWVPKEKVMVPSPKTSKKASRLSYLEREVAAVPHVLSTLKAVTFQHYPNRWCTGYPAHTAFSNGRSSLSLVKYGMYMISKALPHGAFDETDEKWGTIEFRNMNEFGRAWLEALVGAGGPTDLMACQLMLEFCIKSAWFKPSGAKLLSSLPSKAHAMRYATVGMVAVRMWILDEAIRYDKISADDTSSAPKPPSSKSKSKKR